MLIRASFRLRFASAVRPQENLFSISLKNPPAKKENEYCKEVFGRLPLNRGRKEALPYTDHGGHSEFSDFVRVRSNSI